MARKGGTSTVAVVEDAGPLSLLLLHPGSPPTGGEEVAGHRGRGSAAGEGSEAPKVGRPAGKVHPAAVEMRGWREDWTENPVADLFRLLALAAEGERCPEGDRVAAAYRHAATTVTSIERPLPCEKFPRDLRALCASDPSPLAAAVARALPFLVWVRPSDLHDWSGIGVVPIFDALLLSPEEPGTTGASNAQVDGLRAGLFFQSANVQYPGRTHPAEESFLGIAGEADWRCEGVTRKIVCGGFSQHDSMEDHASSTYGRPFLGAWRWSGDIGFNGYAVSPKRATSE